MAKLLVLAVGVAVLGGGIATALAAPPAGDAPSGGPVAPLAPAESAGSGSSLEHYRCDEGVAFSVRFADDSATIDAGPRGIELLLRDAGGTTPQQSVYSNARMRAEFGLGTSGREAILRYPVEPLGTHCVRD